MNTNTYVTKIVDRINTCTDWSDLEKKLLDSGIVNKISNNHEDRKKFVDNITKTYYNTYLHEEEIKDGLPGSISFFNNCKIIIHGMIHDTPLIKLSSKLKAEVKKELHYKTALYEDGFEDWAEGECFEERKYLGIKNDFFMATQLLFEYIKSNFRNNKSNSNISEIETISQYRELRKELFRTYLPGPLSLSKSVYENTGEELTDQPFNNLPTITKRIIFEAKKITEYIKTENQKQPKSKYNLEQKTIHVLVGAAHELPLKYLLKNPEYLDKFKI